MSLFQNQSYYPFNIKIQPNCSYGVNPKLKKEFNNLALQLNSGSITLEETILELRAGGFYDWATLAFIIAMLLLNQGDSFQGQGVPLPHMDPIGWASGKYNSRNAGNPQGRSTPPSRFERETLHTLKQMCHASADDNGFVMSYEDAYNLVAETYSGSMQVTGLGKYSDITHVENKGPVGTAIAQATNQSDDLVEQGRRIAKKFEKQRTDWSDSTKISQIKGLDTTAPLPKSPKNVLGIVDLTDVPEHEKGLMEKSILEASKNDASIEFLNNN